MTHSYGIYVTWLIYTWHDSSTCNICDMTNLYETWHIHMNGWVVSHMNEQCLIWKSRVYYSCHMYYIVMSHVTYKWDMSHILLMPRKRMSHVKYEWVMSHIEWVMSHMNEPTHTHTHTHIHIHTHTHTHAHTHTHTHTHTSHKSMTHWFLYSQIDCYISSRVQQSHRSMTHRFLHSQIDFYIHK